MTELTPDIQRVRSAAFSVLDWLGVIWVVFAVLGLLAFPLMAATFRTMYADFGGELPGLTELVLEPWTAPVSALAPLALLVSGFRDHRRLGARRALVVAAFALSGVLVAFFLVALYLPIFQVANAIGGE